MLRKYILSSLFLSLTFCSMQSTFGMQAIPKLRELRKDACSILKYSGINFAQGAAAWGSGMIVGGVTNYYLAAPLLLYGWILVGRGAFTLGGASVCIPISAAGIACSKIKGLIKASPKEEALDLSSMSSKKD